MSCLTFEWFKPWLKVLDDQQTRKLIEENSNDQFHYYLYGIVDKTMHVNTDMAKWYEKIVEK